MIFVRFAEDGSDRFYILTWDHLRVTVSLIMAYHLSTGFKIGFAIPAG